MLSFQNQVEILSVQALLFFIVGSFLFRYFSVWRNHFVLVDSQAKQSSVVRLVLFFEFQAQLVF